MYIPTENINTKEKVYKSKIHDHFKMIIFKWSDKNERVFYKK